MHSIVFFSILFVTVTGNPIVFGVQDACEVQFRTYDTCSGTLTVKPECKSSMLNLTDSFTSQLCETTLFVWSYPSNNLTIIIETPFTKKHEKYAISLYNDRIIGVIPHVYRIIDGKEIDVTSKEQKLTQYSDSNYQIILKFQAPPSLTVKGADLAYDVINA